MMYDFVGKCMLEFDYSVPYDLKCTVQWLESASSSMRQLEDRHVSIWFGGLVWINDRINTFLSKDELRSNVLG